MPWYFYSNGLPVQPITPGVFGPGTIALTHLDPNTDPEPDGWLFCDGRDVSRTTYNVLLGVIGDEFGPAADPPNDFRLPNFNGLLPRGVVSGGSIGINPTPSNGSGGNKTHSHNVSGHSHTMSDSHRHLGPAGFTTHTHGMVHNHSVLNHRHDGGSYSLSGPNQVVTRKLWQTGDGADQFGAGPSHTHSNVTTDNGLGPSKLVNRSDVTAPGNDTNLSDSTTQGPSGATSGTTSYSAGSLNWPSPTIVAPSVSNMPPFLTLGFLIKT